MFIQFVADKDIHAIHHQIILLIPNALVAVDCRPCPCLPFGSERSFWSASGAPVTYYRFTDQEFDTSDKLYNYDARLYDPALGKFISPDSIVPDWYDPQSLNRYSYARNNPLIYTDPTGHATAKESFDNKGYEAANDNHIFTSYLWAYASTAQSFFGSESVSILYDNYISNRNDWTYWDVAGALLDVVSFGKVGGVVADLSSKWGRKGVSKVMNFFFEGTSKRMPDSYSGIKVASQYLKDMGIGRADRVRYLQSFEPENMVVRQAGQSEFGLRFFSDSSRTGGQYLFETSPASRSSLAIKPEWSNMSGFRQFQIRPGATILEGRASAQGLYLSGGQKQKFILDWYSDLIKP